MEWAIAEGLRVDDPTTAVSWALPRNSHQVQHYEALAHSDIAAALATVAASGAWAGTKLAFGFLVLAAARSGEVRGARWDEIDRNAKLCIVPAERAKSGRPPPRPPLSTSAGRPESGTKPPLSTASGRIHQRFARPRDTHHRLPPHDRQDGPGSVR